MPLPKYLLESLRRYKKTQPRRGKHLERLRLEGRAGLKVSREMVDMLGREGAERILLNLANRWTVEHEGDETK